jgi:hypothetical protein
MNDQINTISINKTPSFTEIWYEGQVESGLDIHQFWLIHPQGIDPNGNAYSCEVRWFYQRIPMEVRAMTSQIIDAFKQTLKPTE